MFLSYSCYFEINGKRAKSDKFSGRISVFPSSLTSFYFVPWWSIRGRLDFQKRPSSDLIWCGASRDFYARSAASRRSPRGWLVASLDEGRSFIFLSPRLARSLFARRSRFSRALNSLSPFKRLPRSLWRVWFWSSLLWAWAPGQVYINQRVWV